MTTSALPRARPAKKIVQKMLRLCGVTRFVRFIHRHDAAIAVYHDPKPEVFDLHLRYLGRRFNFTTLDAIVDALLSDDWSQLPERALAVTIDDGHRGNHALLPVIRKHCVRPTIFLCSAVVDTTRRFWFLEPGVDAQALKRCADDERLRRLRSATGFAPEREYHETAPQALDLEQILEMAPFVDFGAHTRSHPILPRCNEEQLWSEVVGSKQELEKLLARPCRHFAYPNGDHGSREVEVVRRAQFDSARTTLPGWNARGSDPYRLRMLPTTDHVDIDTLAVKLTGIGPLLRGRLARLRRLARSA